MVLSVYIQGRFVFSSPDIRISKEYRMDPLSKDHIANYGERWGTHHTDVASKTGNNVFFAGAKIPTRQQCDDTESKKVSLSKMFEEA